MAGGGASGNGVYTVTGTVGQPDANVDLMTASADKVQGGFWATSFHQPDLSMTKAVTPTISSAGETVTYTLSFSNAGGATATGIIISDVLPISLTVVSIISKSDVIITDTSTTTPTYTWQIGSLAPAKGGVITITVQADGIEGQALTNTAYINSAIDDTTSTNNVSTATFTISVTSVGMSVYLPLIVKDN